MSDTQLQKLPHQPDDLPQLRLQLAQARRNLAEAEAELAQEQAAVNAFRMHCRLKLDVLVETLLELRAQKQAHLTRLVLLREHVDPETFAGGEEFFHAEEWETNHSDPADGELILPTPTPRDKAAEKALYRELARRFHPDRAASAFERSYRTTIMAAVNTAYAEENLEALYDLAGELSPDQAAGLRHIQNREARKIQEAISKMARLRGKAVRQLRTLREENTARLWRRAMAIEEADEDWWSLVRKELEQEIGRQRDQLAILSRQVERAEQAVETSADDRDAP